jgi:hypothetical protein
MKHVTVLLVVLTLFASNAMAQSDAQPTPSGDPNVSKLEGQLVPVGEKNAYLYSFPRFNVSANPIGAIVGLYGASFAVAPTSFLAVRADVNYYQPVAGDEKGFELGLSTPIYFRKMYSGLFVEPGVMYRRWEQDNNVGPQVLLGWHWFWDSGFNFAIAAGVQRNFSTDEDMEKILPNGYMRLGYAL